MINTKTKLTILTEISSAFEDISFDCADSTRDTKSITLTDSDYIYVGFYKPINSFYAYLTDLNTTDTPLNVEYYNGSTWGAVEGLYDDSKAFQRSGFIKWNRNQENEAKTSVNSIETYWYRISPNATLTECTFQAITGLFTDDQDLEIEVPDITDSAHLAGKTSHFNSHLSSRNDIIQALRNQGNKTLNHSTGEDKDLTVWDVLDIDQLKQASTYLALSKIYFNFSDEIDDKFSEKSNSFYNKYEKAFKLAFLNLDVNDNGIQEPNEEMPEIKSLRVIR